MQLTYSNAPLICQMVTVEQAVNNKVPAAATKRSRRGRATISASATDTLREIKLRLYAELEVHPCNMDAYVGGTLLDDNDQSLQQLGVSCADFLNVVRVERVPNDDLEMLLEWRALTGADTDVVPVRGKRSPGKERGFVDTLLAGGPVL